MHPVSKADLDDFFMAEKHFLLNDTKILCVINIALKIPINAQLFFPNACVIYLIYLHCYYWSELN